MQRKTWITIFIIIALLIFFGARSINAGDTIVWENRDTQGHTVTSNDKIEMNSRLLGLGQKYSHTFNRAGFYAYYCEIHPYMTGKVIVN